MSDLDFKKLGKDFSTLKGYVKEYWKYWRKAENALEMNQQDMIDKYYELKKLYSNKIIPEEAFKLFSKIKPNLYERRRNMGYYAWEEIMPETYELCDVYERDILFGLIRGGYIYCLPKEYYVKTHCKYIETRKPMEYYDKMPTKIKLDLYPELRSAVKEYRRLIWSVMICGDKEGTEELRNNYTLISQKYINEIIPLEAYKVFNEIKPLLYNQKNKEGYYKWEEVIPDEYEKCGEYERKVLSGLTTGEYDYVLPKEYYDEIKCKYKITRKIDGIEEPKKNIFQRLFKKK